MSLRLANTIVRHVLFAGTALGQERELSLSVTSPQSATPCWIRLWRDRFREAEFDSRRGNIFNQPFAIPSDVAT